LQENFLNPSIFDEKKNVDGWMHVCMIYAEENMMRFKFLNGGVKG